MGIETALFTAGLSASAASAVVGGTIAAGLGAVASSVLAPGAPKIDAPKPLGEADKPQAKQEVDRSTILKRNATAAQGALAGNSSTLLSGTGGISAGSLNLGSSSLLGQ